MFERKPVQVIVPLFLVGSFGVIVSLTFAPQAQAAINESFTYQGKLLNKTTEVAITRGDASCIVVGDSNDTCDFRVSLYTAITGGTLVWQETKTDIEIDSRDGSFELTLNCSGTFSSCNQNGGPDFNTASLYIELEFAPAGASSFTETFSPRKQLSSVPFAFNADTVDGINVTTTTATPEGSVTGSVGDIALDTTSSSIYLKSSGDATNTGWVLVGSSSGTALTGLSDTTIATPASGHVLIWDGVDSWDNKALSGDVTIDSAGVATISSNALDFTELIDALTLDAATTVTVTDTNKLTWTRTSSGLFQEFTDGTDTFGIYNQAGTPEGSIATNIGSLALDTTNGNLYVKTTDTVNTGWVQLSTTFLTTGGITSNSSGEMATDDFVFGSPQLDDDADATHDARMFFDKSKGAFRAGFVDDTLYWDEGSRGAWSFASGQNTTASDTGATAMGRSATASGNTSTALGYYTTASGNVSTALGSYTTASGNASTALGSYTTAQPYASVVLGRYNVISGTTGSWVDTDPLFVIGNGASDSAPANALTVLKNGNIGVGESIPSALLDIVFASTSTAAASELGLEFNVTDTGIVTTGTDTLTGLDFNVIRTGATGGAINAIGLDLDVVGDTAGTGTSAITGLDVNVSGADTNYAAIFQGGNVGIGGTSPLAPLEINADGGGSNDQLRLTDDASAWAFNADGTLFLKYASTEGGSTVDKFEFETTGNAIGMCGTNCWDSSSDIAFKKDIGIIDYGLNDVMNILPRRYIWIPTGESKIGLVAQELETIIPELVHGESGQKAVSYGGLTPVLVRAIQEQQIQIENLATAVEAGRLAILEILGEEKLQNNSLNLGQFAQLVQEGGALQFTGVIEFLADVVFHAPVTLSSDQVGTLTIPAGATKVKVIFSVPFANPPVVSLTPVQSIRGYHSLEEVTEEGFVVSLLIAGDIDLEFNWTAFVVDGEGAKVEVVEGGGVDMETFLSEFDELTNTEVTESTETTTSSVSNPSTQ